MPLPFVRVFSNAVSKFLDELTDEEFEDASATPLLKNAFPDSKKRSDGRGWLPLHWACAIESTSESDLTVIMRERPAVLSYDHSKSIQDIEGEVKSIGHHGIVTTTGQLPLHIISSQRHPRLANLLTLLSANSKVAHVSDGKGWLPLHWAASNCLDPDVVRALVEAFPSSVEVAASRGQLPLQLAARNRNIEVLKFLHYLNPESIHSIDNDGCNSLHDAVTHFNAPGAAALLNLKPDLALSRSFNEKLPIHSLFYITPNIRRTRIRRLETLRVLLEHHPMTVAMKEGEGYLPLHLAVVYRADCELLEAVRDSYPSAALIPDAQSCLPVHYADGDSETLQILLASSAPLRKAGITSKFAQLTV